MDEQPAPVARFGPDRRYTWLAVIGAVAALLAVAFTSDAAGRLLAAAAALLLIAYVISDLVFAPRLTMSAEGIVVHSPLLRARLAWSQVEDVRAESRIRFGLRATTLEVDGGEVLAVLSRRALGADPERVAELARAFRPVGE